MLSQIRQISDGNSNTVFVKNKEQKFNLDKEIHDLECWKQSRNHVYRKEERELLAHLEKLRHQQEYLHHLDEERGLHPRAVSTPHRGHREKESQQPSQSNISVLPLDKDNPELSLKLDLQGELLSQAQPLGNSNVASLPPVRSSTDTKTLHRTDAHTNICVVCQLPKHSFTKHGHHYSSEDVCCCDHHHEEGKNKDRRSTVGGYEEYGQARQGPIEVGQRRHSLMMARLNDHEKYEHQPHPPDRSQQSHTRRSQESMDSAKQNYKDHDHTHHHIRHVHDHQGNEHENHGHMHHDHHETVIDNHGHMRHQNGHVHDHHGHEHDHHRNNHDAHDHHGHVHDHHGHVIDNHGHLRHTGAMLDHRGYGHDQHRHKDDDHGLHGHHGSTHHHGNDTRNSDHTAFGHSNGNTRHRHFHYGNQTTNVTHTPRNSPHRSSRHSLSHQASRDPLHPAPFPVGHQQHAKRISDAAPHPPESLGTGGQDSGYDARRRDHELHWDRHQVCKLRGMITDPHYKEQLNVENEHTYPWSSQHQENKASSVDIQDLKNCRYLRFSKLNLENMKENPEEEVEVFEKKYSPI